MASTTFEPQPLSAPLNDRAIAAIEALANGDRVLGQHDKKLRDHLAAAVEQLTELTGRLNDRAYERRARHEREQARRRQEETEQDEEVDADAEAQAADRAHREFQQKVESLTRKMDLNIRGIIDDQIWLEDLPTALRQAAQHACSPAQQATQTQGSTGFTSTLQSTQTRTRRRRRISDGGSDEGDGDEDGDDQEDRKPSTQAAPDTATPHVVLAAALEAQTRAWTSKSLTERYAHNNDYKGFYRVLYDAKHPGESAPPMPDERLWFAAEEGRELVSTQRRHQGHSNNDDAEDEDEDDAEIEIAAESIRIKCPITLLPYVDPVTSLKCSHSYERSAILSMLSTSSDHVPVVLTAAQIAELDEISRNPRDRARRNREIQLFHQHPRVPLVKCPECNVPLTEQDLKPNPALKRRVQRLVERARRKHARDNGLTAAATTSDVDPDDDGDEDEDEGDGHRNDGFELDENGDLVPAAGSQRRTAVKKRQRQAQIKSEANNSRLPSASVVPQTQLS
ncbi:hypothetical protein ABEF95_009321 [Exophiala dermatitidis]|uniref:SP-RING-type domain-containing protein n=1 Tax=Exophiala dermatitidis (strain ATCC 34100 / CBS 525.76 / NIH/UT8656) TaxID=858893 RepID=H6CBA4_EXODN|nr:uncharacterized protein HMPREF1120_08991 [Exophiala dermatitidis NIH/UT8656]EHY61051.1 hypothetical protein HMPREF1120_08991 [Exophiala dermatitidis NIH/UT8656]